MLEAKLVGILLVLAVHRRWDEFNAFFPFARDLFEHKTRLSPEDQDKLNQAFDVATSISAKIDAAESDAAQVK